MAQLDEQLEHLVAIMARLRDPDTGCPWDQVQTFETIAPFTIEEAHEVAEAISRGDRRDLCDELGDLLLQVVYHARMAEEEGSFDLSAVIEAICNKMIRRHPHVFGDEVIDDAETLRGRWEEIKAAERSDTPQQSVLDGVPRQLPAALRAVKLQRRAARLGFDWPDAVPVLDKLEEEIAELRAAMAASPGPVDAADFQRPDGIVHEVGDLLFACTNLCRHLGLDPDQTLAHANSRFERRFRRVEQLAQGGEDLNALEQLWQRAKREVANP